MTSFEREKLQYRQSVQMLIVRGDMILIFQSVHFKEDEWSIPGGGIEKGETEEEAVIRELSEEFPKNNFKIIKKSKVDLKYEWKDEIIEADIAEKGWSYRGQHKTQFIVELLEDEIIEFDEGEIRKIKWVPINEVEKYIFADRVKSVKAALSEL